MALVVTVSGSPGAPSRTSQLNDWVAAQLATQGFEVARINVRDLPPADVLHARLDSPALREPLGLIERAQGVVVATPVYKASYTGVLKSFLDLLPQFGLTGKVILPLATGGTLAHVLAIDYGLRPVLSALGAQHVVSGLFILDKLLGPSSTAPLALDAEIDTRLRAVVGDFVTSLRRQHITG